MQDKPIKNLKTRVMEIHVYFVYYTMGKLLVRGSTSFTATTAIKSLVTAWN